MMKLKQQCAQIKRGRAEAEAGEMGTKLWVLTNFKTFSFTELHSGVHTGLCLKGIHELNWVLKTESWLSKKKKKKRVIPLQCNLHFSCIDDWVRGAGVAVSIVTRLWLWMTGVQFLRGEGILLFTTESRPVLWLTQPPMQLVLGALSPG